ncbi:MAG: caspase, EACC1-associated type [Stackebrandtia sp.]
MNRLALLVANDSYRDPQLGQLISPGKDAKELRELLRDPEIGAFDPADILVNASKAEIEREIELLFGRARPGDLVLLYFSGHGVRSRSGRLHLAVPNTEPEQCLAATSVSASFLKERIDESDAEAVVVLLDCCYSGAFADGGVKTGPDLDVGQELAAGSGIFVLTASSAVEGAADGVGGASGSKGLSAFTAAVVRGLSTGQADMRSVGRISPGDLWDYVRQEVPRQTQRQTPTQFGMLDDEIHLARVRSGIRSLYPDAGAQIHIGDLLGRLVQTEDRGLRAEEWPGAGRLIVPVGQTFRGGERAEPVPLRLGAHGGHVLTVGRMSSGKSTLLRTLICTLALTHTPDEINFYLLDSGANKLGSLQALPHVRQLVGDDEPQEVARLLDGLDSLIRRRKQLFRDGGLDSAEQFRSLRSTLPDGPHPDVLMLIDHWSDFVEAAADDFAARVRALAGSGRDYGVHLAVAARRWADVPDELQELFGTRIELRLPDPEDSRVDKALAWKLPEQPGWALYGRNRFRIALPQLRSALETPPEEFAEAISDGAPEVVYRVCRSWESARQAVTGADAKTTSPRPGPQLQSPGRPTRSEETEDAREPAEPNARTASPLTASPTLNGLLDVEGLNGSAVRKLRQRRSSDRLRVPLGIGPDGVPFELDIKEAAQHGMGQHGLMIGAPASGKSELLRSLVLALALQHSPEEIVFALLDFKGGGTFAHLGKLPHTIAHVDNLSDDLSRVDRLQGLIAGEIVRRQEELRKHGNFASLRDYEKARAAGAPIPAMPSLLIICDEFSELLTAKPDFIEMFVQIGRVGRSLGVHLLLASQRLEEGKLRGLDTHLSYRIGLRTFSSTESRTVLGVSDAYELPRAPGHGYLRHGAEPPIRFAAATTFHSHDVISAGASGGVTRTFAEAATSALGAIDKPAPRWPEPPGAPPTLGDLLSPLEVHPQRGLTTVDASLHGALRAPIAVVDDPFAHRFDTQWADLSGDGGHAAVVGARGYGVSMLLTTLIAGIALTHTPDEARIYCIDAGDGAVATAIRDLPHAAGVWSIVDDVAVEQVVSEVYRIVEQREQRCNDLGLTDYRTVLRSGRIEDDPYQDVFLVIHNWSGLREAARETTDHAMELVSLILQHGLDVGVHVLGSAYRWQEMRSTDRSHFGAKLELRLPDPYDSEFSRTAAAALPVGSPGRGITPEGLQMYAALPRIDGKNVPDDLSAGLIDLAEKLNAAWSGVSKAT